MKLSRRLYGTSLAPLHPRVRPTMTQRDPAHPPIDLEEGQENTTGRKRTLCERLEGVVVNYMRRFCDWTRTTMQRGWSSGAVSYDESTHHPEGTTMTFAQRLFGMGFEPLTDYEVSLFKSGRLPRAPLDDSWFNESADQMMKGFVKRKPVKQRTKPTSPKK